MTVRYSIINHTSLQLKLNTEKVHPRHCMLHYFHCGKIAAEATRIIYKAYNDNVMAERTYRDWFTRFKNGEFDVGDRLLWTAWDDRRREFTSISE